MREITGDLFSHNKTGPDAICLTTNGYIVNRPLVGLENTMGRGCAGEAKKRWPGIEFMLGALLAENGNHVHVLTNDSIYDGTPVLHAAPWNESADHNVPYHIVSFPTKPENAFWDNLLPRYRKDGLRYQEALPGWMAKSDLTLIEQSARELVALADERKWSSIVLPRPGVGAGQLDWPIVRDILSPILDDRFYAITFK